MKFQQINYLTDSVMPQVKPNTFKIIMAVARATWGWKKDCAQISFNDFQEATGISGRSTLNNAIKDALDGGFIERREDSNSFCYLMFSTEMVPSASTEIVPNQYGNGTESGTISVPNHSTVKEVKENKETIIESSDNHSLAEVYTSFHNNIGGMNHRMSDIIADAYEEYGGQWILDAITEAVRNGVYKWNYIEAILRNWKQNGRQGRNGKVGANSIKAADDAAGGVYV